MLRLLPYSIYRQTHLTDLATSLISSVISLSFIMFLFVLCSIKPRIIKDFRNCHPFRGIDVEHFSD